LDVPCNKDSTDVNGGGGGGGCDLELFVLDDGGSIRFDEINVGLERSVLTTFRDEDFDTVDDDCSTLSIVFSVLFCVSRLIDAVERKGLGANIFNVG
jgi:hypothetical protein